MSSRLTISIVTYNGKAYLADCLQSLKSQTFQDFSLVIIDNASSDGTVELANVLVPDAQIISLPKNLGFGSAHNIAIHACQSEWILVLNQDTVLRPDCLQALMTATSNQALASIGPLLLRTSEETIDTSGLQKHWYGKVSDRHANAPVVKTHLVSGEVWGISGACALYRKAALDQVAHARADRDMPEYFDEHFFMYKEDVDLASRLQRHGWRAWLQVDAEAIHDRTTQGNREEKAEYITFHSYKNHWFYLLKNAAWYELPTLLIYEMIKCVYLALFERRTLVALKDVWAFAPIMLARRYAK